MRSLLFTAALAACHSTHPEAVMTVTSQAHRVPILDSFIAYREAGSGRPIVFLHGNPTSSYVWRAILPVLAPQLHCLAPDLIGMGRSGKPDTAYRYADHVRYLDAWFDALDLRDVVIVGYDWGGVLAIDWAARHPDRVRGVVMFETILQPLHWAEYPAAGAELFRTLRTPGAGEQLVLEENGFLPRSLGNGVKSGLSAADRAEYEAPFATPASRRPMLAWTRSLPIDGEPADTTAVVVRNAAWLASTRVPALLLTFDGNGLSNAPAVVAWANQLPNVEVQALGAAGHHAPEDAPLPIAAAISAWLAHH
jgi:haloalkane dehalogenase